MNLFSKEEVGIWMKRIAFFKDFTEEEIGQISSFNNYIITHPAGKVIIKEGDIDLTHFIVLRGKVAITKNERPNIKISVLTPGSIFGEVSFLQPRPRTSNVVADEEAVVLRIDGEMFEKLSPATQGKIKDQVLAVLLKRLDDINWTIISYAR